jgi:hypothetical protein
MEPSSNWLNEVCLAGKTGNKNEWTKRHKTPGIHWLALKAYLLRSEGSRYRAFRDLKRALPGLFSVPPRCLAKFT